MIQYHIFGKYQLTAMCIRKIILFILTIAFSVSGCRDEKSSLNDSYLEVIDLITKDDFSLDDAKKAWNVYENQLFASVGFCSAKLFEQCLYTSADLNQKVKSYPQEVQNSYKKLQTAFSEFLNSIKQFKVTDDYRRDLICAAIEKAYEDALTSFFYTNEKFLNEELYNELDKDNSELSQYLCAYFYYCHRHEFKLYYSDFKIYIHTFNIYQTNDKDIKLLVMYNTDCQAELIFITYNKKTHEFKQVKPQTDLYFCNHSSDDHFSLDSQSNIFTLVEDDISTQYVLDLKELTLKKK